MLNKELSTWMQMPISRIINSEDASVLDIAVCFPTLLLPRRLQHDAMHISIKGRDVRLLQMTAETLRRR